MKNPRPLLRAVIKEEYVALTGCSICAILLNQIEYWTKRTHDFDKFMTEEKKRAASEGKEINASLMHGWVYKTAEELSSETMINLSVSNTRLHLKKLIKKGWISERSNPSYRWDRTKQYRFNALQVAKDLDGIGYHLDGWALQDQSTISTSDSEKGLNGAISNIENGNAKTENRTDVFRNAIPEITSDITSEIINKQTSAAVAVIPKPVGQSLKNSSGIVLSRVVADNSIADDLQQLIAYAGTKGIELKPRYAGGYLSRAGGLAGAQVKVDEAAVFIAKEQARGKQIENLVGVLEHVLLSSQDGAKLTMDPICKNDKQRRLEAKEAKYADVYLS